jgi:putative FmdB family regulatory protein
LLRAGQTTVNLWQTAGSARRGQTVSFPNREETQPTNAMPYYEFVCRKCHKKFGEVLTIKEHDTKKLHSPKCRSSDLERVIEPFFAKTASKTHG